MMNALTLAGALLAIVAVGLVLWGLAAAVRALFRRSAYRNRPMGGEGQSVWAGAVEAKDVYVPGTIVRKLGIAVLGLLVAGLGAPLLWAGMALTDFVTVGDLSIDLGRHEVTLKGELVALPLKEFELLELLMFNAGRVLTRDVLIDRVWGPNYFGDTKTLDVHIKRLRSKVELDPSRPTLIVTVRGVGYRYERPHDRAQSA